MPPALSVAASACSTAEVVEPELRIEAAGIVLDERELNPAHRLVEPAGLDADSGGAAGACCSSAAKGDGASDANAPAPGDLQEIAAGKRMRRRP